MGSLPAGARGKGRGRLGLAPGKGRAVSATALAGCGRGRDGRGCGEWRRAFTRAPRDRDGSATDPSPKPDLVTEMPGTSPFLPSSSGPTEAWSTFVNLWLTKVDHGSRRPRSGGPEGRRV